jgi:hypothetical protein
MAACEEKRQLEGSRHSEGGKYLPPPGHFGKTKIKKKKSTKCQIAKVIFKNVFLYPEYSTLINKISLK